MAAWWAAHPELAEGRAAMARRWLEEFPNLTEGGFGRLLQETLEGEDEDGGGAVLLRDFYGSRLRERIHARFLARRDELRR